MEEAKVRKLDQNYDLVQAYVGNQLTVLGRKFYIRRAAHYSAFLHVVTINPASSLGSGVLCQHYFPRMCWLHCHMRAHHPQKPCTQSLILQFGKFGQEHILVIE